MMTAPAGVGRAGNRVCPLSGPRQPPRNVAAQHQQRAARGIHIAVCNVIAAARTRSPGGADQGITAEIRNAYDQALDAAGKDHRTIVYDGAPHSFFDRKAAESQDASDAAWNETIGFIRKHTAGQPFAAAR